MNNECQNVEVRKMSGYQFLDRKGTFTMECPENTGYLYFPVAGENGLKGAVTPLWEAT